MAKPCPNCGNSEYKKTYISGEDNEHAKVYCDLCVKDKDKKEPEKVSGEDTDA